VGKDGDGGGQSPEPFPVLSEAPGLDVAAEVGRPSAGEDGREQLVGQRVGPERHVGGRSGSGEPQLLGRPSDDGAEPPVDEGGETRVAGQELTGELAEAGLDRPEGVVGQPLIEAPDDEVVQQPGRKPEVGRHRFGATDRSPEQCRRPAYRSAFVPFASHRLHATQQQTCSMRRRGSGVSRRRDRRRRRAAG
jgi:hypothetical protein